MNKNINLAKNKKSTLTLTTKKTLKKSTKNTNVINYSEPHIFQQKQKTNSLEELTRKFINYILKINSNTIDLNDFIKKYKVKKRRIYDVTNVLQGKKKFFSFLKKFF